MKFSGTKGHVDIKHNGKIARFWGDMTVNGFSAIANTMEWIDPIATKEVTDEERDELIKEVKKFFRWKRCKIVFTDEKGRKQRKA
jgi:hypothetical protein